MIGEVIGKVPVQQRPPSTMMIWMLSNYIGSASQPFMAFGNFLGVPTSGCQTCVDIMDDFSQLQHIQAERLVFHLHVGQVPKQEPVKKGWLKPRITYSTSLKYAFVTQYPLKKRLHGAMPSEPN